LKPLVALMRWYRGKFGQIQVRSREVG
jgi:hypothetical protein